MTAISPPKDKLDFFAQADYWATCITHFFVDFLNNSRSLIMALLAVGIGLTNQQVGLFLIIYNVGNALSQPLFGWMADRIGPRRLVVGGMAWMILFSYLTAIVSDQVALYTLTVAGLGSGAFHPAGTMVASQSVYKQRNRATALFFMFGMGGLFVGPIVAGEVLEIWGRGGYIISASLAIIALVFGFGTVNDAPFVQERENRRASTQAAKDRPTPGWRIVPIILAVIGYSSIGVTIMTYIPIVLLEDGQSVRYAGWVTGIYLFGGMLGNYSGGWLADRTQNGRLVIFLAMMGAILPLWFGVPAVGILQMILFFIAGFCSSMPHSVLVLLIQSFFPKGRGFASGLALGGMFFTGSVVSFFVGSLADIWDLTLTLQLIAVLPLIAAACAFFIPRPEQEISKTA